MSTTFNNNNIVCRSLSSSSLLHLSAYAIKFHVNCNVNQGFVFRTLADVHPVCFPEHLLCLYHRSLFYVFLYFKTLGSPFCLMDRHFLLSFNTICKLKNQVKWLKEPSPIFSTFFPNFWRFWYHKKTHIFLITHVKFHG